MGLALLTSHNHQPVNTLEMTDSSLRKFVKEALKKRIENRLANESDPNTRRIILEFLDQELITNEGVDFLKQEIARSNY